MSNRIRSMTEGSPTRLLITFALPLMLGNVFQQLYTVVDTAVVGQGVGVEALAAIGRRLAELAGIERRPGLCPGLFHTHGPALRGKGL